MNRIFCIALICLLFTQPLLAENWPGWRGPTGDGHSKETDVPTEWNGETGENIAWKSVLPGHGHGSPIVWNEHLFLAACDSKTTERMLVSVNSNNGKINWQRTLFKAPLETKHKLNSHASCTPATDGELVYVCFLEVDGSTVPAPNVGKPRPITPGSIVAAAYDFEGNQRWIQRIGEFVSAHGFCANPVVYDNLVIINGDHDGDSYIAALDKTTGETVWKENRQHKIRSYVTPLIRNIDGRTQMVFSGSKHIISLDPATGKPHWRIEGPTEQFVASMVCDGEKFYMACGFPTYHVMGIRPDGKGEVTDTHVAWHSKLARCYVPSPVVVGDYLIVADDRGTVNCFRTQDGERLYQARGGVHYSGSQITANGLVYLIADDGVTKIVRPGKEFDVVAENKLGDDCYSSPAMANGKLYIRGEKHLICIGK